MLLLVLAALLVGCAHHPPPTPVAERLPRVGDEIMVCGQLFHTGAPVVLWTDPGGYDAYRTERRFASWAVADYTSTHAAMPKIFDTPNRYGIRSKVIDQATFDRIRGGGWDLPTLQSVVDQFVIHYDVSGTSRQCFKMLQDGRDLSVHFMLDVDGTIYQTLDLKERAWHATKANDRSIGIEIANIGAYPVGMNPQKDPLNHWYQKDSHGRTHIVFPDYIARNTGIRTPGFIAYPARNDPVTGEIQGGEYRMYDLTPQQYDSLIKLTAALCTIFPRIHCDAPRDADGRVINHVLTDAQWEHYHGILGHYHVQKNKIDPGPAFAWDRVIDGARRLMRQPALARLQ